MERLSEYDHFPFQNDSSSPVSSGYSRGAVIQGIYHSLWSSLSSLIILLIVVSPILYGEEKKRIVPLTQGVTEIVYFLGEGKNIVAVPENTSYPPFVKKLPVFGPFYRPDLEKIVSLAPTHVIGVKYHRELLSQLNNLGIKTLMVGDTTIEEILSSIEKIGSFIGEKARGKKLKEKIITCIHRVSIRSDRKIPTLLILDATEDKFFTAGKNSFVSQILELAGGKNIIDSSIPYPQISMEEIVKFRPAVILNLSRDDLKKRIKFIRVKIVKLNNPLLTIPGPRIPLAIELFEKALGLRKEVLNCLK